MRTRGSLRAATTTTALLLLLLAVLARISETSSASGSDAGAAAVVAPSRPPPRPPAWLLELAGGGGCVGALIAPQFALTTATCAARVLVAQGDGVRQLASTTTVVAVQALLADQKDPAPLHDFAVLKLADAASATPVGLLERWDASRANRTLRAVYAANRNGLFEAETYAARGEECDARSALNSTNAMVCVVPRNASACEERHSRSQALAAGPAFLVSLSGTNEQRIDLVGVRAEPVGSCQVGSAESKDAFLPLAALRTLIDRSSKGHTWTPSSSSPDEAPGGAESSASHSSDSGDDPTPTEPVFFPVGAIGFVKVKSASGTRFGAPIALIAPRFALTRELWLKERNSTNGSLVAAFEDETIPIKRFISQREMTSSSTDDIVVLELEADAVTTPMAILKSLPRFDVVNLDLALVVISADTQSATPQSDVLTQLSLSKSQSDGAATSERVIANVPLWGGPEAPSFSSSQQSILQVGDYLIGFSVANASEQNVSKQYSSYPFSMLASKRSVQFLNDATESTVLWTDGESSRSSSSRGDGFPSFVASFTDSSCQAILVAPKYLLTTASCARDSGASSLTFELAVGPSVAIPYSPAMAIVHPKYNRSAPPAERFDIAVVQLAFETTVAPVVLSFSGLNKTDELLGFAFRPPSPAKGGIVGPRFSRVPFTQSPKCVLPSANSSTSSPVSMAICLTPATRGDPITPSVLSPSAEAPENIGGDKATTELEEPALAAAAVGKELNSSRFSMVGFAVAQESDGDDDMFSVTALADFAVFINAYVVGTSWEVGGRIMDAPLQFSKRFIVGLRVSQAGQNFCGGSLIAPSFVLTAAHCVTDGLANWVSIGSKASSGLEAEVIPVIKESIVIHSSYGHPSRFSFDAAIFEIKSPAYADPVVLDQSADFIDGEQATMYGYGAGTSSHGTSESELSPEIHAVGLALLSQARCVATLPEIDESMLCAVGKNGEDACQGDSGGPLVLPEQGQFGGKETLVGFVSSGYECGLKNVPGIYTRVSSLSSFIRDNTVGAEWSMSIPVKPHPIETPNPASAASDLRNLDDPTPRGSDPADANGNARLVSESRSSQTSKSAIRSVDLPADVSPIVRSAVLQFLLGASSESNSLSPELLARFTSDTNLIRFFSTADLSRLLEIIQRHNAKPLYARKDRFGRQQSPSGTITTGC